MQYHNKYFLQTREWAEFWQENNSQPHKFFEFYQEAEVDGRTFRLSTLVYQYPWQFGQIFWYIPKGFFLEEVIDAVGVKLPWNEIDVEDLEILLIRLLDKIYSKAKDSGSIYVKIDFEEGLANWLCLNTNKEVVDFLHHHLQYESVLDTKIIQYLSTITLDLRLIKNVELQHPINNETLTELYHNTSEFWGTTNANVRRYTKKSLTQNWAVNTEKSKENFEYFWRIYNLTKEKHNFAIQSKPYLQSLFNKEFSRVIIIKNTNEEGELEVQGVWFGIVIGDTLTYLYGGNTEKSFENYGQYLIHLVAVRMAMECGCAFYDLGGYDSTKGFGKFKENYRGQLRNFLGPIDVVLNHKNYKFTNLAIRLVKKVQSIKVR
jgi:lipid II:glycine glycyltransferase (peptidoglycan interpeptide bridge formation enzyme)